MNLSPGQNLIVDADDTLWEHTVFYDRAKARFCELLEELAIQREAVREVLDEVETVNAKLYGYGAKIFEQSLQQCYERLAERAVHQAELERLVELAASVLDHPMEVIEGVPDTLEYLADRHHLILFTKGTLEEQGPKIASSGLEKWFGETVIVREKDVHAYLDVVSQHGLNPGNTWMVGNSPRSDVNPALAAGLNAVYIPHPNTWDLEHQDLVEGERQLLILESFEELRNHF